MRDVVILGSTGSVGRQALAVVGERPDRFAVVGLAAGGSQVDLLARQILDHRPHVVAVQRAQSLQDLQLALYAQAARRGWNAGQLQLPRILAGPDAAAEVAGMDCDVVLNAITGSAGLVPTLTTLAAGTTLALANKESLVVGGRLVTTAAAEGQIVAVDSEHSALAQCLRSGRAEEVERLILTASGGPFRGRSRAELAQVTPQQALQHPTWSMGRVITTNSATLVNKGLELLEAHLLYGVPLECIDVVVHPQSMVHSMVQFVDGSTLAQCSPPDMRLAIAWGLTWPERLPGAAPACDWTIASSWTFEPLDEVTFPAVALARRAGGLSGTAPAVLNAANEACVDAFSAGHLSFPAITDVIAAVLDEHVAGGLDIPSSGPESGGPPTAPGAVHIRDEQLDLPRVLAADRWARERAQSLIAAQGNAAQ